MLILLLPSTVTLLAVFFSGSGYPLKGTCSYFRNSCLVFSIYWIPVTEYTSFKVYTKKKPIRTPRIGSSVYEVGSYVWTPHLCVFHA